MTAEAVAGALTHLINAPIPARAFSSSVADSIEATGPLEITIKTPAPQVSIPGRLGAPEATILAPAAYVSADEVNPIGHCTGAFEMVEVDPKQFVKLERFDGYWGEPAKLDSAEILFVPDGNTRATMARSGEAIRLAERLIPEPTLKQEGLLFRAVELRRRAQFSFEHGWYRRAVGQAHRAEQLSLMAVLNGERPTVEDAQQLLGLADEMIAGAQEAIGDSPTEAQQRILQHAIRLRDRGAEAINTWQWRGVGLLWRSAITSAVLIP